MSSRGFRSHSFWITEPGSREVRRLSAFRLLGLSEVLESFGRSDEARRVARAGLRAYVSMGEDKVYRTQASNENFLSAIEFFFSHAAVESVEVRNSLIRLYSRLLHTRSPEIVEWSSSEHAILRSCVLHALSGGSSSALADLQRKCRVWRYNMEIPNRYVKRRRIERKSEKIAEWGDKLMEEK